MKMLFASLGMVVSLTAGATQLKVAVIDTGLDLTDARFEKKLCLSGHKDFTGEGIHDSHGHGTHVAGLIQAHAGNSNYCLIVVKFWGTSVSTERGNATMREAIAYAAALHADFVNISAGGEGSSLDELRIIANATKTRWITAAGNYARDLDAHCDYFPACYRLPNVVIVGSRLANGRPARSSNVGSVISAWELGEDVLSTAPGGFVRRLSGTSMATAVHTGRLLHETVW